MIGLLWLIFGIISIAVMIRRAVRKGISVRVRNIGFYVCVGLGGPISAVVLLIEWIERKGYENVVLIKGQPKE